MKAMAILFRVVFSIIVLLALTCYLQIAPSATLGDFCNSLDANRLADMFGGINTVTVSIFIIILLGVFSFTRVLEAVWNIIFCASVLVLLTYGLYTLGGAKVALPHAIYHNEAITSFCQAALAYEVPLAIAGLIFIAGWICTAACGRVAITAVVSYGLWYALTEFFTYIVHLWGNRPEPAMPETLNMIQSTPWVIAAVPGAFFLIYALLMAFFETFINTPKNIKKAAPSAEEKKEDAADNKDEKPAEPAAEKAEESTPDKADKKPAEPAAKSQPILKTTPAAPAKKLKLATPAAEKKAEEPKADPKSEPEVEPKVEEKADEKPVEKAEETAATPTEEKVEETPAAPTTSEAKEEATTTAPAENKE